MRKLRHGKVKQLALLQVWVQKPGCVALEVVLLIILL